MKMVNNTMKKLYNGNEAIARGAYEAGVRLATGYPGTPCTGIIESVYSKYKEIYCEWGTNEKVALEVAIGSSFAGYRSLVVMKTVGLNVAHDALIAAAQSKINGGLVLVVADDVGRIPSDDYNDCRYYGDSTGVPILEPSDSQEAKEYVKFAFDISEQYSLPVIVRLTSIICKTKSIVNIELDYKYTATNKKIHTHSCYGVIHTTAILGMSDTNNCNVSQFKYDFTQSLCKLSEDVNSAECLNKIELKDRNIGIITSGISFNYIKETLPNISILKLGMVNPLPQKLIKILSQYVKKLYIIEDGQNILENKIKSFGINIIGKELFPKFPYMACFTPDIIAEKILLKNKTKVRGPSIPYRLPLNCAGCSHLFVYHILKKHKIMATTDVTCGGIGVFPHINAFCSAKCMGSSIGIAHGYNIVSMEKQKFVAVIGDGGFWATGINNLVNMVYNNGRSLTIIVDNECIAMTGGQSLPSSDFNRQSISVKIIDIAGICRALKVEHIVEVDPYKIDQLENAILNALNVETSAVVIVKKKCLARFKQEKLGICYINADQCAKCNSCLNIGCPAIEKKYNTLTNTITINCDLCVGCKLCINVCKNEAIKYVEK